MSSESLRFKLNVRSARFCSNGILSQIIFCTINTYYLRYKTPMSSGIAQKGHVGCGVGRRLVGSKSPADPRTATQQQ